MFGQTVHTNRLYIDMKHQEHRLQMRLPKGLHIQAIETARQRGETLSAILRRHLEAYTASQPTKQAA